MPGDSFKTYCVYNTEQDDTPVLGGMGTQQEMCFNFVTYYPALDVEECVTIFNKSLEDNAVVLRDGRQTAYCGDIIDVASGNSLPQCSDDDWNKIRTAAIITVLPNCKLYGSGCSSTCKQLMYNWIHNNPCIDRNGFEYSLTMKCQQNQTECLEFKAIFEQCKGLCAIGLGDSHCSSKEFSHECAENLCLGMHSQEFYDELNYGETLQTTKKDWIILPIVWSIGVVVTAVSAVVFLFFRNRDKDRGQFSPLPLQ